MHMASNRIRSIERYTRKYTIAIAIVIITAIVIIKTGHTIDMSQSVTCNRYISDDDRNHTSLFCLLWHQKTNNPTPAPMIFYERVPCFCLCCTRCMLPLRLPSKVHRDSILENANLNSLQFYILARLCKFVIENRNFTSFIARALLMRVDRALLYTFRLHIANVNTNRMLHRMDSLFLFMLCVRAFQESVYYLCSRITIITATTIEWHKIVCIGNYVCVSSSDRCFLFGSHFLSRSSYLIHANMFSSCHCICLVGPHLISSFFVTRQHLPSARLRE